MRWLIICLLIVNLGMVLINGSMWRRSRLLIAQLTELNSQLRTRLDQLDTPPIPYTPGMTLMPGQSTVIEIPLNGVPRDRSY